MFDACNGGERDGLSVRTNQRASGNSNIFQIMQNQTGKPDWPSIRRCVELGVPLKDAAEKFNVTYEAIKKRNQREAWITPAKIEQLRADVPPASPEVIPPAIVAGTIAEMGSELKITTLQKTLAAIKRADLSSLPIDSWQDAKIAFEVGLKAAGLDSQAGPAVSVIVSSADSAPLVEIDAVPLPELL
jgi:hypothetical protein